jgi:hypothetical protein
VFETSSLRNERINTRARAASDVVRFSFKHAISQLQNLQELHHREDLKIVPKKSEIGLTMLDIALDSIKQPPLSTQEIEQLALCMNLAARIMLKTRGAREQDGRSTQLW